MLDVQPRAGCQVCFVSTHPSIRAPAGVPVEMLYLVHFKLFSVTSAVATLLHLRLSLEGSLSKQEW